MINKENLKRDLAAVREKSPLVHNITNYVAMNFSANALLALGASPVMAHAADEVAVSAFLSGKIDFLGISDLVYKTYDKMSGAAATDIDGILAIDNEARKIAKSLIDSEIRRKN